jgi:hypothetical protein
MARTAVKKPTTKKVAKKVTPAKANGRKSVAKKPAVRKPKTPKIVDPNKYGKFYIEDAFTEKYPTMVLITASPKAFEDLIGKKYVNRERCIATLEVYIAEGTIAKGEKSIIKELDANGILPLAPAETDEK